MNGQALGIGSPTTLPRMTARCVTVTGGKGGVGKSSVAANLAATLAKRGLRVLCCDLDFALGNLNVLLGIEPTRNVEDYFDGLEDLRSCITRDSGGFDLLPAGSGTRELARPVRARREALFADLAELSTDYDWIVLDTAAGIGSDVLEACLLADRTVLVTGPEPTALTDAYGLLKALDGLAGERGLSLSTPELFINRVAGPEAAEAIASRLSRVAERFLSRAPRLAGWCPDSREVAQASHGQRPFVEVRPSALATRAIERLAARFEVALAS